MIDIGNHRLKKLAFDRCHSIDLSFDYPRAKHWLLVKKFYSDVMPCISHDIRSLIINIYHISRIKAFVEKTPMILFQI